VLPVMNPRSLPAARAGEVRIPRRLQPVSSL